MFIGRSLPRGIIPIFKRGYAGLFDGTKKSLDWRLAFGLHCAGPWGLVGAAVGETCGSKVAFEGCTFNIAIIKLRIDERSRCCKRTSPKVDVFKNKVRIIAGEGAVLEAGDPCVAVGLELLWCEGLAQGGGNERVAASWAGTECVQVGEITWHIGIGVDEMSAVLSDPSV